MLYWLVALTHPENMLERQWSWNHPRITLNFYPFIIDVGYIPSRVAYYPYHGPTIWGSFTTLRKPARGAPGIRYKDELPVGQQAFFAALQLDLRYDLHVAPFFPSKQLGVSIRFTNVGWGFNWGCIIFLTLWHSVSSACMLRVISLLLVKLVGLGLYHWYGVW